MCVIYDLQQLYGFAIGEWSENGMEREGETDRKIGIKRQTDRQTDRQTERKIMDSDIILQILAYLDRSH